MIMIFISALPDTRALLSPEKKRRDFSRLPPEGAHDYCLY